MEFGYNRCVTAGFPDPWALDQSRSVGHLVPDRTDRINNYTRCDAALTRPRSWLDSMSWIFKVHWLQGSDLPPTKYSPLQMGSDARARCNNRAQCIACRGESRVRREYKTSNQENIKINHSEFLSDRLVSYLANILDKSEERLVIEVCHSIIDDVSHHFEKDNVRKKKETALKVILEARRVNSRWNALI